MKRITLKILAVINLILILVALPTISKAEVKTPYLKKDKNITRLYVDDKPFVMLAGELHNSTSSSESYFAPLFSGLKNLNLNTVIASVAWEQFEPVEGKYNFSQIDALIKQAELNDLKLIVIWFASWKNGKSNYVPMWVKQNQNRFMRARAKDGGLVKDKQGNYGEFISTLCPNALEADAKAFEVLMRHIKQVDKNKTVIMMQVQNEVGLFQDMDYCSDALKAYSSDVPKQLLDYLKIDKKGNWEDVFGDSPLTKERFMAWSYATYINTIAERGKKIYNLPMYVNAWVRQNEDELAGNYPCGGPVDRVIDIYKAAAPLIDFCAPDIYLENFKETVAKYHSANNPIFVPEARLKPENLFYTITQHDALGFAPFGIEDGIGDFLYSKTNEVLKQLMPIIIANHGSDNMVGFAKNGDERGQTIKLNKQTVEINFLKKNEPCFGVIIERSPNNYIVAGMNCLIEFSSPSDSEITLIGQITEGQYSNSGDWVKGRMLNGDEGWKGKSFRMVGKINYLNETDQTIDLDGFVQPDYYNANRRKTITTPAIYKIKTYQLKQ